MYTYFSLFTHNDRDVATFTQKRRYLYILLSHKHPFPIYTHKKRVRHCNRMINIVLINCCECKQMTANPDQESRQLHVLNIIRKYLNRLCRLTVYHSFFFFNFTTTHYLPHSESNINNNTFI